MVNPDVDGCTKTLSHRKILQKKRKQLAWRFALFAPRQLRHGWRYYWKKKTGKQTKLL